MKLVEIMSRNFNSSTQKGIEQDQEIKRQAWIIKQQAKII